MSNIRPDWGSHQTTSIAASSVTNGSTATTSSGLSMDGISSREVVVAVTYGATPSTGLKVYILRQYDASNYEAIDDNPQGFELPFANSATRRKVITVDGRMVSGFKVLVKNDTGQTVTATVTYRDQIDEAI